MKFPLNAYLLALGLSWALAFFLFPLWRRFCLRWEIVDDPGHRKIHSETIPLAGGLTVLCSLLLTLAAGWIALAILRAPTEASGWVDSTTTFLLSYGFGKRSIQLAGIAAGAVGMLLVGLLDDRFELSPAIKFTGQFIIALGVALCGARLTIFVPSLLFSYLATILWILTVVNAFNFMDNMNGLCTGIGAIAAGCFAAIAAMKGQYLVASLGFVTLGALLGFLPHNFPRASAFLGDGGSHLVGYLMAVMALLPHFHTSKDPSPLAVLTPLLVLAVPLGDMAWVVLLRWRLGQPFYVGDNNHLSHRLVDSGFSRTKAVFLIWLLTLATGALAFFL